MPMTPWSAVRWPACWLAVLQDLVFWSGKASEVRDRLVQRPLAKGHPWRGWSVGRPCTLRLVGSGPLT
jgi:hypothetical protein